MPIIVNGLELSDAVAAAVDAGDRTVEPVLFDLVQARLPPKVDEDQSYMTPGNKRADIMGITEDLRVIVYFPGDPEGRRSQDLPLQGVQDAISQGRWTLIAPPGPAAWVVAKPYVIGERVTYEGEVWVCIQDHVSQVGWEPPNVPALWNRE